MGAEFHYAVRIDLISIVERNFPQPIANEKEFKDEDPIIAREKAFDYLQSYVDVLLQSLGTEYTSDKQARKELRAFTQYEPTNSEGGAAKKFFGGIGVFLIQDENPKLSDWRFPLKDGFNNIIYSIGRLGETGFAMEDEHDNYLFVETLDAEYRLYEYFNYDTKNYATVIEYYGPPLGTMDDDQLLKYKVLETPFDWTDYGKMMEEKWQMQDQVNEEETDVQTINNEDSTEEFIRDLIKNGESETVEFKPALFHDFRQQSGGPSKRVKAISAKAICAFLNTRGGFLIIGVNDKREIIGLENDYKLFPENGRRRKSDGFRLEFDSLINQFFERTVRSQIVTHNAIIDGKDIFLVKVHPSKKPIFLKGERSKEFYIRGAASSQPLIDIEQIVNYCMDKWGGM
jgi:hypothetical protein